MKQRPQIEGIVKRHPDGFGFLIPDDPDHPDVYIPKHEMNGIMTNDRILADVMEARGGEGRYFGEVIKVVTRATKRVIGRFFPSDDGQAGMIYDEAKAWGIHLHIPNGETKGAKAGELVAVEIIRYPGKGGQEFLGKVISIIGDSEDPLNDIKRIIYGHHIPHEFTPAALKDARKYGHEVTEDDMRGREDLRHLPLITIDGVTAKDFDDAICVEPNERGFRLWVAIADVSHYVKPGTALDREAYEKGTSTYFPNFVVPMLPEELSNELCSLKPNVPRLSMVSEMQINFDGEIVDAKFYEAVIESKARVTYGEAQEVIDGATPDKLLHVEEVIRRAADLAKILMGRRFRDGSLDLEIPETEVVVDQTGQPVDIIRSERIFAHRLIEELMLIANISVARFLSDSGIPALYRIHEPPAEESIQALQRFLHNFGGKASMGSGKLQKKLTRALQAFEGKAESQILNILTLRTMNQAKYSGDNVGHFGLGFDHYTHFTSPIRRYPDLIVHRLLKSLIYPAYKKMQMSEEDLASAGNFLSACEQRSVKAERQLISIKKARFMDRFVGQSFDGFISSVTKFGIFVLLRAYDVDGLVKVEELGDDRWMFDDENLVLRGKHSGETYKIGDTVRIQVAAVDVEGGKIDFVLGEADEGEAAVGAEAGAKVEGKRLSARSPWQGKGGKKGRRAEREFGKGGKSAKGERFGKKSGKGKEKGSRAAGARAERSFGKPGKAGGVAGRRFDQASRPEREERNASPRGPRFGARKEKDSFTKPSGRIAGLTSASARGLTFSKKPIEDKVRGKGQGRGMRDDVMVLDEDVVIPVGPRKKSKKGLGEKGRAADRGSKENRKDVQKRGKVQDDRRSVRKKRLSKRR